MSSSICVIEPTPENLRRRPSMYVGSTGASGVDQLVAEVVANAVDQFLRGAASRVAIRIEGDTVIVSDDGVHRAAGMCRGFRYEEAVIALSEPHHTGDEVQWHAWANGVVNIEGGSHLEALQRAVARCELRATTALIHVVGTDPEWAGPTRSRLVMPELVDPLCHALQQGLVLLE